MMKQKEYKLLIFDLDGLLVNTEMMHWKAYESACRQYGISLEWDFDTYFQVASTSAAGIRERLSAEHPALFSKLSWELFYETKHLALLDLLAREAIPLMPGVERLLLKSHEKGIPMACVTHSRSNFVDTIRSQHACLRYIESWYTRESYDRPKPAPDGYVKVVTEAGIVPEEAIGFEDSLRGLEALRGARVIPVLVTKVVSARTAVKAYPEVILFSQIDEAFSYGPFHSLFSN